MKKIIITHDNADFDAFASMFAAQKLYPDHTVILNRRVSKTVRDFLSLHFKHFECSVVQGVRQEQVDHVVIVDVRRADRLRSDYPVLIQRIEDGELAADIYDHHGPSEDDLPGEIEVVEEVGAAITLLIEEIRHRAVEVESIEATLFALGIHMDTGSLAFAGSTSRDARALGWCMDQGANLRVINKFLKPTFDNLQRDALTRTLANMQSHPLGNATVGIAVVPCDQAVSELGLIVSEIADFEDHAAIFGIYPTRNRTFVIARSRTNYIDVGRVLRAVGGGGHARAAAATLKSVDAEQVVADLLAELNANPLNAVTVKQIMTNPVITVEPRTSLGDVAALFRAEGISGAPVELEGDLIGVISADDVTRAEREGRGHLAVNSCMSHIVQTISSQATLEQALYKMVEHNIGRLPVMRRDLLVGIVTRTDVLRVLYGLAPAASDV